MSKKCNFSTDFSQNCTKRSSTIELPWQLSCIQNESLLVYSKSHKTQPVGGSPPPGLFKVKVKPQFQDFEEYLRIFRNINQNHTSIIYLTQNLLTIIPSESSPKLACCICKKINGPVPIRSCAILTSKTLDITVLTR